MLVIDYIMKAKQYDYEILSYRLKVDIYKAKSMYKKEGKIYDKWQSVLEKFFKLNIEILFEKLNEKNALLVNFNLIDDSVYNVKNNSKGAIEKIKEQIANEKIEQRENKPVKRTIEDIRKLIEDDLKWNDEDIKKKFTNKFLVENKFSWLLNKEYGASCFKILNELYPNKFHPWEMANSPRNYWNKENAVQATKWLFDEKLKWSYDDIRKCTNLKQVFKDNGLYGMLHVVFDQSVTNALKYVYPNEEWNIHKNPKPNRC